ncbi:endonuclease [Sphingobacteriales bacterium UPWRP_1]|nr:hypothetical protein B6N25_10505 [Sphingobacteriales bacterium TSM_CSS]PSJ79004.1 endonuclease [Sphingobacteriales bacterium UPWRP_1]
MLHFRILILLLFIFLTASCSDETKPISGYFTTLSYNVAGLPEGISSSHPALYTSLISPLLNEFDVVHVQEDFCYHDSLLLYNTHPYVTQPMPCVPNGDGLNTFSDFPIQNLIRQAWVDCFGPDCLTPKGFSYSQIEILNGAFIDFYNVHCDAGSTDEDFEARRSNIRQLCNYIQVHSQGQAVVVMGDFNSRYTREADTIRAFEALGFTDVWVQLVRNDSIPAYGESLKDCQPLESGYNCEGIDKIFYRSSSQIELLPVEFRRGDDNRFTLNGIDSLPLSDHLPLFCRFHFNIYNQ